MIVFDFDPLSSTVVFHYGYVEKLRLHGTVFSMGCNVGFLGLCFLLTFFSTLLGDLSFFDGFLFDFLPRLLVSTVLYGRLRWAGPFR
jgi:hypothetical protein